MTKSQEQDEPIYYKEQKSLNKNQMFLEARYIDGQPKRVLLSLYNQKKIRMDDHEPVETPVVK